MAGASTGVAARVVARSASETGPGPRFRVVVSESYAGAEQIDVTGAVVAAIAHSLWQARGGDPTANWVDAERAVESLAATAPGSWAGTTNRASAPAAPEPKPVSAPSAVPVGPRHKPQPTR